MLRSEVLRSCELTEAEVRTRFESLVPLMNHCGDAVHNRLLRAGLIAEVTIQVTYFDADQIRLVKIDADPDSDFYLIRMRIPIFI